MPLIDKSFNFIFTKKNQYFKASLERYFNRKVVQSSNQCELKLNVIAINSNLWSYKGDLDKVCGELLLDL